MVWGRNQFSDERIISAILANGRPANAAIGHLFNKYWRPVLVHVNRQGGTKEDAEDALSEGISNLVLAIQESRFKGHSQLGTYLFSICKNSWANSRRKYKPVGKPVEQDHVGQERSPHEIYLSKEERKISENFFNRMGEACKKLINLHIDKVKMKEIAKQLGYKSADVVSNKKKRCLNNLKNDLKNDPEFLRIARELEWKI